MNITDVTAGCWYTTSKFIGDHFTSGILAHRNEHFYFFLSERRMRIKITFYIEMTQEFLDGFLMRIKDLVNFEQCTKWDLVSQANANSQECNHFTFVVLNSSLNDCFKTNMSSTVKEKALSGYRMFSRWNLILNFINLLYSIFKT